MQWIFNIPYSFRILFQGIVVGAGGNTVFGRIAAMASKNKSVRTCSELHWIINTYMCSLRQSRTTLEREVFIFVLTISGFAAITGTIIIIIWAAWLRRAYPGYINVPTLLIDVVSVTVSFKLRYYVKKNILHIYFILLLLGCFYPWRASYSCYYDFDSYCA